jgi:preprotein translocase subunit SecD
VPPTAGTLRVGRYLAALFALLVVLYGIVFWPHQPRTPKLGLDLEGGTQVILKADANGKTPSKASMNLARQIINDRVNGLGVSSAEVAIQGSDRIVVSVPGKNGDAVKDVGNSFLLQFRPAMIQPISAAPPATPSPSASGSAKPSGTAKPSSTAKPGATVSPSATLKPTGSASPSAHGRVVPRAAGSVTPSAASPSAATSSPAASGSTASPAPSASASGAAGTGTQVVDQWAAYRSQFKQDPPKDATAYNALDATHQNAIQTVLAAWPCNNNNLKPLDQPQLPLISCSTDGTSKYLLGAVIVKGTEIKTASAVAPGTVQGQLSWSISLDLKPSGQKEWAAYTAAHNEQSKPGDVANLVAYTLDSRVTEAATIQSTITGSTSITGQFTQATATNFANSLKYGALPLNFTTLTNSTISPTLGTDQLKAGLLAGGIGLALVILYSLFYYRALGLVTIASLIVSGGLTYAMLVILGKHIGFTLTLAGIAGFIVAVGITADSFVVFFERIKDEVHEGRTARVAIPRAWDRARRTILSADFVSFLAAATLYYFAAGEVRGFAFTLGLSTLLDLVVVFLFTHPLVSLFSRSAAFGSARFTGLDHVRVAGVPSYRSSPAARAATSRRGKLAAPAAEDSTPIDSAHEPSPASEVEVVEPVADEPIRGQAVDEPEVSERPVPASGSTAAERAAARRAAQKAKSDEDARGSRR